MQYFQMIGFFLIVVAAATLIVSMITWVEKGATEHPGYKSCRVTLIAGITILGTAILLLIFG